MSSRKTYTKVSLPTPLIEAVDLLIKYMPVLGFTSRAEVVKYVLRKYLLKLVETKVLTEDVLRKMQ